MTKISQYKGIKVTVTPVTFTEQDVKEQLDYLLSQYPETNEKEGPVENGDTTLIDYCGKKDDVAFEGGTAQGYELVIGSHSFIPGFEEQMIGMEKGETRDLHLSFPENYHAKELAGAEVVFTVTVHKIYTKKAAELTDDFVAGLNIPDVKNVADIMKYTKDGLAKEADYQTQIKAENAVMDALIDNTEAEPTQDQIDLALQNQVSRIGEELSQQGIDINFYLQMQKMTMDDLKAKLTETAKRQCILQMALDLISKEEDIKVTEAEIEAEYQQIAQYYRYPVEEVQKQISPVNIGNNVRIKKASQVVFENAEINVEEKAN